MHQRRGEVRGRPTTSSARSSVQRETLKGMIGFAMHQRRGEVRERPTTKSVAFGPPPYSAKPNRDDSFAPHNKLIQSAQSAPKLATCHLPLPTKKSPSERGIFLFRFFLKQKCHYEGGGACGELAHNDGDDVGIVKGEGERQMVAENECG